MRFPSGRATLAFFCLAVVAAVSAGGAAASQFKRIRDISVACTDALTCDVSAYNAQSEVYTVIFRREARPAAPVRLVLGVRETLAGGSDVTFFIDGRQVLTIPVEDLSYRAAVYEYIYDGEEEIAAMIAAAKAGQDLRVRYRSRGLDAASTFSLNGFVAGLIFMDEVQGRIGRDDALQGDKMARAPDETDLRRIATAADIPFQLRAEFADREGARCGSFVGDQSATIGGFEARTGGETWLVGIPCGAGGAYNQAFAFWERNGSTFRPVALPVMTAEGPSTNDVAWNALWDAEKGELTGFFKGRGVGDCGSFNRWRWTETGEAGRHAFVLVEARAKEDCDGDAAGGPENWPPLWPVGN